MPDLAEVSQRWDAPGDVLAPHIAAPVSQQVQNAPPDQALVLGANGAAVLSREGPRSEQAQPGWLAAAGGPDWPAQPAPDTTIASPPAPGSFSYSPRAPSATGSSGKSTRFAFTLASLLVAVGGILLLLVAIMAPGLAAPVPAPVKTVVTQHAPTFVPSPQPDLTPALSPTPTYPAQQYIDTVQLASAVNTRTAQPMTPATSFKLKQQIFVTFMVHPEGHAGAVCLRWFLNNQYYSHYEFAVGAATQPAYSYTFAGVPGPGYVQIYWASSVACTDRLLAQQASFTVTT